LLDEATWGGLGARKELDILCDVHKLDPTDPTVCDAIAEALNTLGRHREALSFNKQAIELATRFVSATCFMPDFFIHETETLSHLARPREARRAFTRALAESPSFAWRFMSVATALDESGGLTEGKGRGVVGSEDEDVHFWLERMPPKDVAEFNRRRQHVNLG